MKYADFLAPANHGSPNIENNRLLSTEPVVSITPENITALKIYLQNYKAEDPYLRSAAYYATTGRYGLWIYRGKSSLIIFCRHPNVPDKNLIFPPVPYAGQEETYDDLLHFLGNYAAIVGPYQFFRFSPQQAIELAKTLNQEMDAYCFRIEPEMVLDTAFPSHIISTQDMLHPDSPELRYFRRRVKRIDRAAIETITFDDPRALPIAQDVFAAWDIDSSDYASYLVHYNRQTLDTSGFCLRFNGKPCAVALWDVTDNIANALVTISDTQIPGISAFLYQKMAELLIEQDISYMCLGGSEEEGLDFFKRKLNPVKSIELVSIQVTHKAGKALAA